MKKLLFTTLLLVLSVSLFAKSLDERKLSVSLGYQHDSLMNQAIFNGYIWKGYISSHGVFLDTSFFFTNNIGLCLKNSFLQMNKSIYKSDAKISEYNHHKDKDFSFLYQISIAPVFKFPITSKFDIYTKVGLHTTIINVGDKDRTVKDGGNKLFSKVIEVSIGLLGNIGFKYNITEDCYINLGSDLTFDFASYRKLTSSTTSNNSKEWKPKYLGGQFLPYIGMGIKFKM